MTLRHADVEPSLQEFLKESAELPARLTCEEWLWLLRTSDFDWLVCRPHLWSMAAALQRRRHRSGGRVCAAPTATPVHRQHKRRRVDADVGVACDGVGALKPTPATVSGGGSGGGGGDRYEQLHDDGDDDDDQDEVGGGTEHGHERVSGAASAAEGSCISGGADAGGDASVGDDAPVDTAQGSLGGDRQLAVDLVDAVEKAFNSQFYVRSIKWRDRLLLCRWLLGAYSCTFCASCACVISHAVALVRSDGVRGQEPRSCP